MRKLLLMLPFLFLICEGVAKASEIECLVMEEEKGLAFLGCKHEDRYVVFALTGRKNANQKKEIFCSKVSGPIVECSEGQKLLFLGDGNQVKLNMGVIE